jgi:hypothetical protein
MMFSGGGKSTSNWQSRSATEVVAMRARRFCRSLKANHRRHHRDNATTKTWEETS